MSNVILPDLSLARCHPIISVATMGISSAELTFIDHWGGREDLENGIARIIGRLDNMSLKSLLVCFRRAYELNLKWTKNSEKAIENAAKRLALTAEEISDVEIELENRRFAQILTQDVYKMFRDANDKRALYSDLDNRGIIEPLDKLRRRILDEKPF